MPPPLTLPLLQPPPLQHLALALCSPPPFDTTTTTLPSRYLLCFPPQDAALLEYCRRIVARYRRGEAVSEDELEFAFDQMERRLL